MADTDDEIPRIVIDNGTHSCKYGLAGEDSPEEIRTLINQSDGEPPVFGDEAVTHTNGFKSPIECTMIEDWDAMEALWSHILFEKMNVQPEERAILLTEPILHPKVNREKMVEIMFEKFNVPKTYLALAATLALYGSGRTTGLVVDSGECGTSIVPIYEGYALPHAIDRFIFAGDEITTRIMNEFELNKTNYECRLQANEIKEKFSYFAEDYDAEILKFEQDPDLAKTYTLPDGTELEIGKQAFYCSEVLFTPSLGGRKCIGLDQNVHSALMKVDCIIRHKDLYSNIVLAGGTTLIPGFNDRLLKGIKSFANETTKINVVNVPERRILAWIGGSILASLQTFREMWIPKSAYEEQGPAVVHKFCF